MRKTPYRPMSFGQRLNLIALCFLLPIGFLAAGKLQQEWHAYSSAETAVKAFQRFRIGLSAMEKVSAERGPTNSSLGADPQTAIAWAARLSQARRDSDRSIEALLDMLKAPDCAGCSNAERTIEKLRAQLTVARDDVDRLLAMPKPQRDHHSISGAVNQMIDVIPTFTPVVNASAATVVEGDPASLNCLLVARLSSDLREQAGQLGSVFTAALSANRPMDEEEIFRLERTGGRIDELRALIFARVDNNVSLNSQAFHDLDTDYFGKGRQYIQDVRRAASRPGGANLSPAQLATAYVPMLSPISVFREQVLGIADREVTGHRDHALSLFVETAVTTVLILLVIFVAAEVFRRRFVQPLIDATDVIKAIADGELATQVPQRGFQLEIRRLFSAIEVLKENSIARTRLQHERDELIRELERTVDTDFLTRLLNRGAFERKARALIEQVTMEQMTGNKPTPVLAIFDVDRFKQINDTYGHAAGDRALQMIARVCADIWTAPDIVARIGGEEFAVLSVVDDPKTAIDAANRMRQRIESMTIPIENNGFSMTVSIGIAVTTRDKSATMDTLLLRADKLLYRAKLAGRNCVMSDLDPQASSLLEQ
jgi:diguanylate cyclase (GGDEF)-like protein